MCRPSSCTPLARLLHASNFFSKKNVNATGHKTGRTAVSGRMPVSSSFIFVVIVCTLFTLWMITLSLLRFCLCSCYSQLFLPLCQHVLSCLSVCMSSYWPACLPVFSRCRCSVAASESLSFFLLFYQTLLISLILRQYPLSHKLSLSRGITKFVRLSISLPTSMSFCLPLSLCVCVSLSLWFLSLSLLSPTLSISLSLSVNISCPSLSHFSCSLS